MDTSSIDFINKEEHNKKTMDLEGPANFETAISHTGFGKFNILVVLVSVIGMCCNMLDTSALSFILPSAECDLRLSSSNKGILNAITYAGMVCSSGMWGFLSDSFGRWKILVNGYILNGVICVLSSFSQSYEVLLVLRFLVGFVGFGPFAVLATYVAEVHAAPYRASAVMFLGMAFGAMNLLIPEVSCELSVSTKEAMALL
uniref:Major facilitator superfamily (MFS) profile domain-containing protein n=1 Tax=Timema poppense TaxID=170557 RepID=A0A7R9CYT5_TIMPO|nr:unnamed protein product [Timema poppensis]